MKTPFRIDSSLLSKIDAESLLLSDLISPIHTMDDIEERDEDQEYCLTLDGINFCIFALLVVKKNLTGDPNSSNIESET